MNDFPRVLDARRSAGRSRSAPVPRKAKSDARSTNSRARPPPKWDYLDAHGKSDRGRLPLRPARTKKVPAVGCQAAQRWLPPDPRPLYNQPGMRVPHRWCLVEGENARRP